MSRDDAEQQVQGPDQGVRRGRGRPPHLLKCSLVCASMISAFAADVELLYRGFRDPPRSYSLSPYWFWNGTITPGETRRQIREMIAQGVHEAILFPWDGMSVRYLSEDYWRQVGAALDAARELGFTLNIADEYDWPSGHAWDMGSQQPELSRVLQKHPEFRMRRLAEAEHKVEGPREWSLRLATRPEVVVAGRVKDEGSWRMLPVEGDTLRWQAPPGRWLVTVYTLEPAVGGHNTRVDLLNPDAVKAYLDMVYEEYARRFPKHLGTTLKLTVADHEGAYGVPIAWTPRLWQEFERRKGYDLRPRLPLLTRGPDGKTRSDYLEVISDLYVESFTRQVTDWNTRHGLKHGMSAYEEQFWIQVAGAGNMFDHWRATTFVMIDALLERARMPIDFKEAVSVAHFDRKPLVVENQGLQGHATYFSLEKARLGTNMCLVWGANKLVPYFDYEPGRIQWPPQWFRGQPFWRYFHHYADYVRRAQYMNAQGRHVAPILLYYPLETAYAQAAPLLAGGSGLRWGNAMDHTQNFYSALQLELTRAGWDYHIADAKYLARAEVRGGELHLADEVFRVLILPLMTDMDAAAASQVRRFVEAGGVVMAVGRLPRGLDAAGIRRFTVREHPPFMDRLDYIRPVAVPEGLREDLRPLLEALDAMGIDRLQADGIHWSRRTTGDIDWYWVVNDTDRPRRVRVPFSGSGVFEKWAAESGERTPLGAELVFGPWDAFFVVRRPGVAAEPPVHTQSRLATLPRDGWTFATESPVRVPYAEKLWLAPERLGIRDWLLIGPFPYDDHQGFYRAYPPETEFKPEARYQGAYGEVSWKAIRSPEYIVTPRDALGLERNRSFWVYYAHAEVHSPKVQRARFLAAFADSLRVWINGKEVLSEHRHPKWLLLRDAWAETRPIELRKGANRVLLKIGPSLSVPTAFSFRIEGDDPAGKQVRPRVVATRPRTVSLFCWTDTELAHYSGTALYERRFNLASLPPGRILLDLGEVGVAAEAWVNGKHAGERVWRPFRFDVTGLVKAGVNCLKIRVANSDAGWLAQGGTLYPRGSWGLKYQTERDRLPTIRPNGLEGPVAIYVSASSK